MLGLLAPATPYEIVALRGGLLAVCLALLAVTAGCGVPAGLPPTAAVLASAPPGVLIAGTNCFYTVAATTGHTLEHAGVLHQAHRGHPAGRLVLHAKSGPCSGPRSPWEWWRCW
ncbi:hypothetical protein QJS66_19860 [Kocuria rhizophila]|nr:hypothetical protein QJS66_19860 [Kocuria rhizophila]